MTPSALAEFRSFGVQAEPTEHYGAAFVAIGIKRGAPGSARELLSDTAAVLSMPELSGAMHPVSLVSQAGGERRLDHSIYLQCHFFVAGVSQDLVKIEA